MNCVDRHNFGSLIRYFHPKKTIQIKSKIENRENNYHHNNTDTKITILKWRQKTSSKIRISFHLHRRVDSFSFNKCGQRKRTPGTNRVNKSKFKNQNQNKINESKAKNGEKKNTSRRGGKRKHRKNGKK